MNDPDWYRNLTPHAQEAVDQTLHLVCGFALSAIGGAYLSMVSLYIREFWIQLPVEPVQDTRTDMAFWTCGAGIYEVARLITKSL